MRKSCCSRRTWTATRRLGFSPWRPAPRPEPFLHGREDALDVVPFPQQLAEGAGVFPGKPQHLRPGVFSLDFVVGSGLDYTAASTVPYRPAVFDSAVWASASMSPDPRGILVSISLRYGESFALPGVTAAAHILPPKACTMCSFANCLALIVPYLALCQSWHLDMPKPGGIDYIGAVCRGIAGQPADYLVQYGGIYLRYAQVVPRPTVRPVELAPLQVPRMLGEVPCQPPMERPLLGFQDGHQYGRDAPVPLAFGKAQHLAYEVCCLFHPFYIVAALGLAALGISGPVNVRIVPLAGGSFLLPGRLGLFIFCFFDFLLLLLMLTIGIGDQCAFRSRARAVLSVGVAGSFRFWTRLRGLPQPPRSSARTGRGQRAGWRGVACAPFQTGDASPAASGCAAASRLVLWLPRVPPLFSSCQMA